MNDDCVEYSDSDVVTGARVLLMIVTLMLDGECRNLRSKQTIDYELV